MDLLLHPPNDAADHAPHPRGRLSTIGHRPAFRAFARAAKQAGVRFMVIGGTYRDALVRAASTGDIDVVLVDQRALDPRTMTGAGFAPVAGEPHAWRYRWKDRVIRLEVAAVASSTERRGPFSIAFQHAEEATIEGVRVSVPRIEDYVILKLLAAIADRRRRGRDLLDVQYALEASAGRAPALSLPRLRGRLRAVYGVDGDRLKEVVALLRQVPKPRSAR